MYLIEPGAPVLLLCAHPDDEIGCGGFANMLVEQGHPVHYAYFSDCAESTTALGFPPERLIEECHQSCKTLGILSENIHRYNFPARRFPQMRQEILDTLVQLRQKLNPQLVLVTSSDDIHQDHATLSAEALRAFKHTNILCYEFPWNQTVSHLDFFVRLKKKHIEAKIRAWQCYKTQESRAYYAPDVLESLARVRGLQAGGEFAESFKVMRLII